MYYYILDKSNVVVNSIVVADGDDPTKYGSIADERPYNIGDTWAPVNPPEPTLEDRVSTLETSKADQTSVDELNEALNMILTGVTE